MKKIIPIIVAVAVVGVALYFFVFSPKSDAPKPEVRITYSPGDYFTTNVVTNNNQLKLLKAAIVLVYNDETVGDTLKNENARIRDTIIFILRDLTDEEILAKGTQDMLRENIISSVNERLGITSIVEVLFTDFVMA